MHSNTTGDLNKKNKAWRLAWAKHQQRWFGKWHLYLGIIAGAIVAFVGVTGSILVFENEIDQALNPALFTVQSQQHKMSFEELVPLIKAKNPLLKFDYILKDVNDKPNLAYRVFNYATEQEIFINPYTGSISGKRLYESTFISTVTGLHTSLLVPVAGRYIVGIATLCLLILTITGLRLWIPKKWKYIKASLTIKRSAGFKRENYDWHNVLGFYTSPMVAMLSLTGFCLTFSPLIIALLFILSGRSPTGVQQLLGAKSAYTKNAVPLPMKDIMAIGHQTMPEGNVAGIAFPTDSLGNYRLDIVGTGLPKSGKREMLIIDQYTGKIILNSRTDFPPSGNAYLSWLTPIHYGSFGGLPTKILALIGGLMPLVLFITGFIIWWPRYRRQERHARNKKTAATPVALAGTSPKIMEGPTPAATTAGFAATFKKGIVYALWCVLASAAMGLMYGLPAGVVLQPAVFAVCFAALLAVLNFTVSFAVFGINLIFFMPFKRGSAKVTRYFALSLAMVLVYLAFYLLLMNTGMKIF